MLIREGLKRALNAVQHTVVGPTCSTGYDSLSGVAINGNIHDLQAVEFGGVRYRVGAIAAQFYSTLGSTAADQKLTLALKLQHGDSSGGGDMADYSTGFIPNAKVFGTTIGTTVMSNWTTGVFSGGGPEHAYDLRAAKQFIRAVVTPTINDQATSTVIGAIFKRVAATVVLSAPDGWPAVTVRGPFTTATASAT